MTNFATDLSLSNFMFVVEGKKFYFQKFSQTIGQYKLGVKNNFILIF